MKRIILLLVAITCLCAFTAGCGGGGGGNGSTWSVTPRGSILEIAYGQGASFPQYAALHVDSGYFRMNYGPGSGWGTSVVVMPSFWEGGIYHQGGPITDTWRIDGADLVISIEGTVSGLHASGEIRISPPRNNAIRAEVDMTTSGDVNLDSRPGEAFKPVMLSSMHISGDQWDAQSAYVGAQSFAIPASGWIVTPPSSGTLFGLEGGTSTWKTNAPTVEIALDEALPITGWVTASSDPNNDNVGFWWASDQVLRSWHYTIAVKKA